MITKQFFEQIRGELHDHEDPRERQLVDDQRCPICGLAQIYVGKQNFKNGKGFAICANPDCDNVEELGIDREHEFCPVCNRLVLVERVITIGTQLRFNLICGHSIGWGETP